VREDLEILYTTEASVTVEAIGGTIKVDSSAGQGTCVVVTLPIAPGPDQEIESFLGPPQELGSPTSPA
jgi:hypothetical protein